MTEIRLVPQKINNLLKIDRTTLKLIAIFTMLVDHVGFVLFPQIKILRWIGRIAFPIFVYQLIEGFENTSNVKKYFFRLFAFALISEIPFDMAFFGVPFYWGYQNVYFELCFILLGLILVKRTENCSGILRLLIMISVIIGAQMTNADYGAFGVLVAFFFYQYKNNFLTYALSLAVFSVTFMNTTELFSLFSLPLIFLYQRGNLNTFKLSKPVQYLFYWFYPLHIAILAVIKTFICK